MIEDVLGLFKVWLITKAVLSPVFWIFILLLFSVINMTLAVFVKFKNGFVSLVSFILCEGLGVAALVALLWNNSYRDALYLEEGTTQQLSDVTPEGIVYRKVFRKYTEPLLGIKLPEEGKYFDQARENILNARFSGYIRMYKSTAYSGVVICDYENISLNEQLLYDGLAKTTKVAPKQYVSIQKGSMKSKRGMWAVASDSPKESYLMVEFTIVWLVFILCVCTSLAITKWLKRLIKIYSL